jgi:hypothetical protein
MIVDRADLSEVGENDDELNGSGEEAGAGAGAVAEARWDRRVARRVGGAPSWALPENVATLVGQFLPFHDALLASWASSGLTVLMEAVTLRAAPMHEAACRCRQKDTACTCTWLSLLESFKRRRPYLRRVHLVVPLCLNFETGVSPEAAAAVARWLTIEASADAQGDLAQLGRCDLLAGALVNLEIIEHVDREWTRDLSTLKRCSRLRQLRINKHARDISPLAHCVALETLDASHVKLTDIRALAELPLLKNLIMFNCVDFVDVSPILRMRQLRFVDLRDTAVPREALKLLKQARPSVKVICRQRR